MISFGPVLSRRLGISLGINNIPGVKKCSYSCIYCQVGNTKNYLYGRKNFYEPSVIFREVSNHLEKLTENDKPDYLTFVANGEPTLDINLGNSIEKLKKLNFPIAVITNASLLSDHRVRADLRLADWVSVKIDAGSEAVWKKLNRPKGKIDFETYVKGLTAFSLEFNGTLASETMLVEGVNDTPELIIQTVELILSVAPAIANISVPTRPLAVSFVQPPDLMVVNEAYQIFSENGLNAELLLGFEGTHTGFTGNAIEDIINICSVHPMREDAMQELLKQDQAESTVLETLLFHGDIQQVTYKSKHFYIRKFRN